jgi:SSS family solute:Na+ symporter
MHLQGIDYTVVVVYGVLLLFLAQWVSREKKGHEKNTQDFFLAGRAGVAMGASLNALA